MPHVAGDVTLIAVRMSLNTNAACLLPCVEFCLKTLWRSLILNHQTSNTLHDAAMSTSLKHNHFVVNERKFSYAFPWELTVFCMHHSPKGVVPFLKILYLLLIIHFLQNTADLQVGAGARFKHWLCYTQAKNNSNLFCKRLKKKQKQTVAVLWLAISKALNQFHIVHRKELLL